MKPNFYLFNTLVNPPKNWQEMLLELNFNSDASTNRNKVTLTDWTFCLENSKLINKHITDGLLNGVGIFEGIPFRIELERGNELEVLFDGYLDLTQADRLTTKITSDVKSVELDSIDWLNDVADSITFDYLYKETNLLTDAHLIKVPYVISSIPNYVNSAVAVVGVYIMAKELKDTIQKLSEFIADLPVYYVFSTYVKLILYIIYIIFVIIALIKLIRDIITLLIQPVKYHSGARIYTQLEKGAEYFGLKIKCPDFEAGGVYQNTVIIPQKYYVPKNKKDGRILGFTDKTDKQDGFYKGTFGQLIREAKKIINGKVIVENGTLWIVRDDFEIGNPEYTLPDIYNSDFTTNANEFVSNTYITFQTDLSDRNTIQEYLGTSYQVLTQPIRVNNSKMVLTKGLNEIRIPFALAKEKTDLTGVEQVLDVFVKTVGKILGAIIKAINAIIKVLNIIINLVNDILKKLATIGIKIKFRLPNIPTVKAPNFSDTFSNRKGMMILDNDLMSVAKIVDLDIKNDPKMTKISANNKTILSAKYLYKNYYYVNDFVPTSDKPNGRQFYLKNYQKVPFTFQDYKKVKANNCIFVNSGETALIDSLQWNPYKQQAEIKLRINKLYTNNLRQIEYEPDGQ